MRCGCRFRGVVVDRKEMSNKSFWRNTITFVLLHRASCIVSFAFVRFDTVKRSSTCETLDEELCAEIGKNDERKKRESQRRYRFLSCAVFVRVRFWRRPVKQQRAWSHTYWASRKERHSFVGCQVSARHTSTIFKLCQPNCDALKIEFSKTLIYSSSAQLSYWCSEFDAPNGRISCNLMQLK